MRRRIGQITIGDINKPVWVDIWKDNNENPYVILTFNVKEYHYAHESYVHKYAEALGFRSRYIYSRYGSYVKFNLSLPLDNAQVYLDSLVNVTERLKNQTEKKLEFKIEKNMDWVISEKMFADWITGDGYGY